MGFKEVMALRQEGNLTEALTLAQKTTKRIKTNGLPRHYFGY